MNLQPTTRIADFFVEPHATITDADQRQGARILAALMLTVAGSSVLLMGLLLIRSNQTAQASAPAVLIGVTLILALYIANRLGHYPFSAYGFIALTFMLLHGVPVVTGNVNWLLFTPMLLIFTIILLPLQAALVVYLLSIAAQIIIGSQLLFAFNAPQLTTFTTVNVLLLTGAVILVYMHYRDSMERDRRAEVEILKQKLHAAEAELERRVEERTLELKLAKDRAEAELEQTQKGEHLKMQFLSSMSHQLRTPLNSVLNFTDFVHLEMLGPINEQQKDALAKTLESGRTLLTLLNKVLDITKIEAGMMRLFLETDVNVQLLLPEVVSATQTLLKDNPSIELVTDLDDNLPLIDGDTRRLSETLLTLLTNACKFTLKGSITLSAKQRGDQLLFCVSDTGIGIAPEEQQRIFKPFHKLDQSRLHNAGTGMSLAIAQWVVNAHGGQLWVESAIGEGSAFFVTLPIKQQTSVSTGRA